MFSFGVVQKGWIFEQKEQKEYAIQLALDRGYLHGNQFIGTGNR